MLSLVISIPSPMQDQDSLGSRWWQRVSLLAGWGPSCEAWWRRVEIGGFRTKAKGEADGSGSSLG